MAGKLLETLDELSELDDELLDEEVDEADELSDEDEGDGGIGESGVGEAVYLVGKRDGLVSGGVL